MGVENIITFDALAIRVFRTRSLCMDLRRHELSYQFIKNLLKKEKGLETGQRSPDGHQPG